MHKKFINSDVVLSKSYINDSWRYDFRSIERYKYMPPIRQKDWNETLLTKINRVSTLVFRKCGAPVDMLIVSQSIKEILEGTKSYRRYRIDRIANNHNGPSALISSKYEVYVDYNGFLNSNNHYMQKKTLLLEMVSNNIFFKDDFIYAYNSKTLTSGIINIHGLL